MSTSSGPDEERGWSIPDIPVVQIPRVGIPPTPLTPLLGRQRERTIVAGHVEVGVRLITLAGVGGVGKTRLALQLAVDLKTRFDGGVRWVPLATVHDASLVLPAIAQALALPLAPNQTSLNAIPAALQDIQMLLILDNVEHVVAAADQLADLLQYCPGLVILATSRTLLRISGEQTVHVPPLEVPAADARIDQADLVNTPSLQLFIERSRAVAPDVAFSEDDVRLAADICRRLEGLPLAIELAAASTSYLPLPALWTRLERRLPVLTNASGGQPDRHRTMRDAIAWSHDLLGKREQPLFRGLAVHSGGWRLGAVTAMLAHLKRDDIEGETRSLVSGSHPDLVTEAITCIRTLTDHHLVLQDTDPDGEPRFTMLETIREFALEQLDASGERGAAERARVAHLIDLAERHRSAPGDESVLSILDLEVENIREALNWLVQEGDESRAFRLAGSLASFWIAKGYYQQGLAWLERLLMSPTRTGTTDRAEPLIGLGYILLFQGESVRAQAALEEAVRLSRAVGAPVLTANALTGLAVTAGQQERYATAMELLLEALTLREHVDNPTQAAFISSSVHSSLGKIAHGLDDLELARRHLAEALAVRRNANDTRGVSRTRVDLGNVAVDLGDHDAALAHYREALTLATQYPNPPFISQAFVGAARIALERGQATRAARLLGAVDTYRGEAEAALTLKFEHQAREQALLAAHAALGPSELSAAMAEGRAMSLLEAISELDGLTPDAVQGDNALPMAATTYGLTPREVEVLRGIVDYLTDREIAERLFISRRTVGWHVTKILTKLGVSSRRQAASKAVKEHVT